MSAGARIWQAFDSGIAPVLEDLGFRGSSRRGWTSESVQVRIVVDSKARDLFRGAAFTVEFEKSANGTFGKKLAGCARIDQLLDAAQRADFLATRNSLAARFVPPPEEHIQLVPAFLRDEYQKPFQTSSSMEHGFWMRFQTDEHLQVWCRLLAAVMPDIVARADALDPRTLYSEGPIPGVANV